MKKTIALVSVAVLSACTVPRAYNRIDADAMPIITSMDSYLFVTNSELGSEIDTANMTEVMGGGLLWALVDASVDASRTKTAEQLIGPIRDKLIDFDFASELESAVEAAVKEKGLSSISDVKLERTVGEVQQTATPGIKLSVVDAKLKETDASAVLIVDAKYSLAQKFDGVNASASASVFPKSAELNAFKEKPDEDDKLEFTDNIYRNTFAVSVPFGLSGTSEENATALAEMDADEIIETVNTAIERLAEQIVADLMLADDVTTETSK